MSVASEPAAPLSPLLKWAGGKRALASRITPHLTGYNRYWEPFFGGGAIFFDLGPKHSCLSDLNPELINCYQVVKDKPLDLIKKLKQLKNDADTYYEIRASRPTSDVGRAARLVYLCNLSFNGIYRVNKAGQFNVPYGHKTHIEPCDSDRILAVSKRLQSAEFQCADFASAVKGVKAGDCVYFDPPYTVAHGNNGFVKYNEKIFSWKDQVRLEKIARKLALKGAKVVISNADHPSLRELYKAFEVETVERWSVISAASGGRKSITECVFLLGD